MAGVKHRSLTPLPSRQAAAVLFIAGALMALGFAPYHFWPILFVSLPVFYLLLASSNSRAQAIWRGWYFGYGYSMAGTWWIAKALLVDADKFAWMLPFSILGLSAVMALWFALFGAAAYVFRRGLTPMIFASLWMLIEYLRSLGMFGFPWNLVGYMSLASLEFAQMASIIGTYGLSFLFVLVGTIPVLWLHDTRHRRYKYIATALALTVVVVCYSYGFHRLEKREESATTTTLLRVVQPSIPQEVKGTRAGAQLSAKILDELTTAKRPDKMPDVIIWPETAYPFTVRTDGDSLPLPRFKGILLTGAVRAEGQRPHVRIWNSLIATNPNGEVLATYDKHQLVPFGEFVPMRSVLPLDKITPGDTDFSRGPGPRTMKIPGIPSLSPQICYESIFPWLAVDQEDRPSWILNVTNDGWYGDSPGPYQHFDMVRMRAIEQGLPVVRAANSGISAVISGKGVITSKLDLNQRGMIDVYLPKAEFLTYYASTSGNGIQSLVLLCIIFLLFYNIWLSKDK